MRNRDFDHHYILQDRMPTLQSKIDKLNEKLKAAGAPLITLKLGEPEVRRIDPEGNGDYMPVRRVEVSREVLAPIGRIELLAATKIDPTTQFMEHRTFTKLTRAEDEKVRSPIAPCFCDHCETNRLRIYIYTLKTPEGVSRVGSGCLDSFAGFSMSKWQEAYKAAVKTVEEIEAITFTDAQEHTVIPVDLFLREAVVQIEANGYRNGYSGGYHTGGETFTVLRAKLKEIEDGEIEYSPQTVKKADEIKAFIISSQLNPVKRADDYYSNLRALLDFGHLTHRQAGLLASSVISHEKEMRQVQEQAKMAGVANAFYGSPKDKVKLKNLKVDGVYPKDGQWGPKTEIVMYDEQGHMFKWNATGLFDLKKGQTVHLTGTLAKHENWTSHKLGKEMFQNTVSHCKFHSLEEIEALIVTPVKVKKPRKARELDDSPSP